MRSLGSLALGAYRLRRRIRNKLFALTAGRAFASFGARSVVELPVRVSGERFITVGSDVYVGADSWLQVIGDAGTVALSIGDRVSIAGSCVLSAVRSVRVGPGALLARNVYIADHSHHYSDTTQPVRDQGVTRVEPVEIGAGAWLGQNVVVGPGVRIGRGAVVGANSVVLADVPDHAVAVGAPARVVKSFGEAFSGADHA